MGARAEAVNGNGETMDPQFSHGRPILRWNRIKIPEAAQQARLPTYVIAHDRQAGRVTKVIINGTIK